MNKLIGHGLADKRGQRRVRMVGAGLLILLTALGVGTAQADSHRWASRQAYSQGYADGYRDGRHDERFTRHYAPTRYARPPVVVDRVIERPVVYHAPPPTYAYAGSYAGGYDAGNRVLSAAMLGAAGGFLGSQVGHGSGRAAATAAGALAGWMLGSNLGR